jgi:hypothetical protein
MRHCFVVIVLLSLSRLASAQGFGTIVGTVNDPSGGLVASAKVTAVEAGTGISREAVTTTTGGFVIPALRPTSYTLTVEASGFNKYTQSNITLTADQSVTVNVALALGQTNQVVTVESEVAQTDTYTSTIKEVVDQQRIVDLPLNGRNAAALTTLVPGAVISPNGGADQGNTKTFPGAVEISTNGSRQNMVAYYLDGGNNVDGYTNVNMPFPFPDALQEFSVQTANYSAEFGGNAGGVVNVVTKSGTNQIHGDFFGFLRNGALNARNYFAAKTDALKRGQSGGTIGGPIRKDRTFFFAGYQGTTIRSVTNGLNQFAPTQAERNGDFSALLSATDPDNPLSKAVVIKDPANGQPFGNNQIPVSRFDQAAIGTMKYLPQVTGTGISFYSSPVHQNFNETLGRVDHIISNADRMSVRYFYDRFTNAPVYTATNILSYADGSRIVAQNILAQETHIFSPALLNDFRAGFSRDAATRGPADDVPNVRAFGVTIPYQPPANDIQLVNVNGFFKFGDNPFARFTRNNFLWSDDLRWVKGRHSLSMGGDFERRRVDLDNGFNQPGLFTFNGTYTGLSMSDFVLGDLYQFQQAKGQFENTRVWAMGFYLQDNFHAASRLTLNLGLRWEPYYPWHEIKGRVEGFSIPNYYAGIRSQVYPNAPPGLLFRGDPGFPENGVGNNFKNFAPRVGFAWDVTGNGKTSIRGGAGMFYDSRSSGIFNNNMVDVSPFSPNITLTPPPGPYSNPLAGQAIYASVLPGVFPPPKDVAFPLPISAQTFNLGSSSFQVPVVYNWNLAIEHQFGNQWLARIAYVGSHSSHLSLNLNLNPAVYIPGSTLSTDQRRVFQPYSDIPQSDASGNANYNSAQFTLQKRFAHSVSVLANYSYQKTIDNVPPATGGTGASTTGGGSNPPIPWYLPGNRQLDYGLSDFNRQHVFVVSYVWDLPKPATNNKLITGIAGGWEITGIVSAETGLPFTVFAGKDISQTGLNMDRGVVTGTPLGDNACHSAPCVSWLNPNSFALPAAGNVGNVGKGAIVGPGLFNWDMGAFKNIRFSERWRAQLRGEFFNTFNHSNFTNSNFNYPNNSVNAAGFGTITAASDPRILQLALKVTF